MKIAANRCRYNNFSLHESHRMHLKKLKAVPTRNVSQRNVAYLIVSTSLILAECSGNKEIRYVLLRYGFKPVYHFNRGEYRTAVHFSTYILFFSVLVYSKGLVLG